MFLHKNISADQRKEWLGCGLNDPEFKPLQDKEILLFSKTSRLALGPTRPVIQWVLGTLLPRQSSQGMRLTTHLYLVLKLRISGTIPLVPCMLACTVDNFTCIFIHENNFLKWKTYSKEHENIRLTSWIHCRILIPSNYFIFQL